MIGTFLKTLVLLVSFPFLVLGQQNPNGQLPVTAHTNPYLFLIRDPLVHAELRLDAAQRHSLNAVNDALDAALWSMRNKSAQHIEQTMQTATATAKARLASILSESQQRRLWQIELWTLGPKAFLRDDFTDRLALSPNQRQSIRDEIRKTREAVDDLGKQLQEGAPVERVEGQAHELCVNEQKQIVQTLNARQRKLWLTLLGDRIDVSELGRVAFKAPEFRGPGEWVNSEPQTLARLKGKVVALHFYAFG